MTEIKRQQRFIKKPKEMEGGPYTMWKLYTIEEYHSDGTVTIKKAYKINPGFIAMLPKSYREFNLDSRLSDIFEDFNNEIMGNTRIGVVIRDLKSPKKDFIFTVRELREKRVSVNELSQRPNISINIAIKFKMMLEFYGFSDILLD